MTNRVIIYARSATTEQAGLEASISDQVAECSHYANMRGWDVVRVLAEAGASGISENRPAFQQMITESCAETKPWDIILVRDFARIFRDTFLLETHRCKLLKHGISIFSAAANMLAEGPVADRSALLTGKLDQVRQAEAANHTVRAMLENARAGSTPPFGYVIVNAEKRGQKWKRKIEPHPEHAEVVRLIFRNFLEGNVTSGPMGIKTIAHWLNNGGHLTPRGKPFHLSDVQSILTNEIYVGSGFYNRTSHSKFATKRANPRAEWIEFEVPALIDEGVFHRARLLLKSRQGAR